MKLEPKTFETFNKPLILALSIIAFILVMVVFAVFMQQNTARIVSNNSNYIKDATEQTAARVSMQLDNALHDIQAIAHLESNLLDNSMLDKEEIASIASMSSFDYLEYVDAQGQCHRADGSLVDVSHRRYFQEGIQGKSGVFYTQESMITHESMLVFYTPVYINDDSTIVGVMIAEYGEERLTSMLQASYFGYDSSVVMVNTAGVIVASSNPAIAGSNLLDQVAPRGSISSANFAKLSDAIATQSPFLFNFTADDNGIGLAYLTPIAGTDMMLMGSFPSAVSQAMVDEANNDGRQALIEICLIFLAIFALIIITNEIIRRRMSNEVRDKTYTYEALAKLFERMVLIDIEHNTYRYLDGGGPENNTIPLEGPLPLYLNHLISMVAEEEQREDAKNRLSLDFLCDHLPPGVDELRLEYRMNRAEYCDWEDINIICIGRNADHKPSLLIATSQNVSDLKEREQSIRQALLNSYHAAVEASQAKTSFLSQMSHDIRTPMNAIIGMTALARLHVNEPDRVNDYLDKIAVSSDHLLQLVNEVLDLSKIESGKISLDEKPFHLSLLIENLSIIFQTQAAESGTTFIIDTSRIVHDYVLCDSLRLQQIFINLLGNAFKFTSGGGTVRFTITERPSRLQGINHYEFIISDTGRGMAEEFMDRMFEPFVREDDTANINETHEGTGLGLPIAKNIIQLMNGTIEAHSVVGEGTTFTVILSFKALEEDDEKTEIDQQPENQAEAKQQAKQQGEDTPESQATEDQTDYQPIPQTEPQREDQREELASTPKDELPVQPQRSVSSASKQAIESLKAEDFNGLRILLVEDNLLNMEIAAGLLETMNIVVERAEDGSVAVEAIRNHEPGYYDLIFMDIQMPVMDGYTAMRTIRTMEDRPDLAEIPIVALSANAFIEDVQNAKNAGANEHLAKPIDIHLLARVIHTLTDEKIDTAEN